MEMEVGSGEAAKSEVSVEWRDGLDRGIEVGEMELTLANRETEVEAIPSGRPGRMSDPAVFVWRVHGPRRTKGVPPGREWVERQRLRESTESFRDWSQW
jgi:hypothetical protein